MQLTYILHIFAHCIVFSLSYLAVINYVFMNQHYGKISLPWHNFSVISFYSDAKQHGDALKKKLASACHHLQMLKDWDENSLIKGRDKMYTPYSAIRNALKRQNLWRKMLVVSACLRKNETTVNTQRWDTP